MNFFVSKSDHCDTYMNIDTDTIITTRCASFEQLKIASSHECSSIELFDDVAPKGYPIDISIGSLGGGGGADTPGGWVGRRGGRNNHSK